MQSLSKAAEDALEQEGKSQPRSWKHRMGSHSTPLGLRCPFLSTQLDLMSGSLLQWAWHQKYISFPCFLATRTHMTVKLLPQQQKGWIFLIQPQNPPARFPLRSMPGALVPDMLAEWIQASDSSVCSTRDFLEFPVNFLYRTNTVIAWSWAGWFKFCSRCLRPMLRH